MNAAILYDAREEAQARLEEPLMGRPLYSYSLKRIYLHSNIDIIVILCRQGGVSDEIMRYIEKWKKKYGSNKSVWIFNRADGLQGAFRQVSGKEKKKPDLFIFHDIRYPFLTEEMIYMVQQKASVYGLAVSAEGVDENISFAESMIGISGREEMEPENFYYIKYPVAVGSGHKLLGEVDEPETVLRQVAEENPYLCKIKGRNPAVYSREDLELAEAIMRSGVELHQ